MRVNAPMLNAEARDPSNIGKGASSSFSKEFFEFISNMFKGSYALELRSMLVLGKPRISALNCTVASLYYFHGFISN